MAQIAPITATKPKEKSFDDQWNLIRMIQMVSGIFVFPGVTDKPSLRLLMLNPVICTLIIFVFAYGTFKFHNFNLMSHILCDSILINLAASFYGSFCIKKYNPEMLGFINWCRSLYKIEEKFHPIQQKIVRNRMDWVHLWSCRLIKGTAGFFWCNSFMMSAGFAFVGHFLPESMYPKFSQPLPYNLPVKDQKNFTVFWITLIGQIKCAMDIGSFNVVFLGIFYTIFIHIHTYLNIIKETITLFGEKLEEKHYNWLEEGRKSQEIVSNQDNDVLPLEEWFKLIVDMISESNTIITTLSNIFTHFFFFFEFGSFGALFIFGLIITVIHQQYFFAFGIIGLAAVLFVFCYINEKILEKFEEIFIAFYEIPWYTLTPKERKLFSQVLHCRAIQKGFMASGIHGVTFERFNKIVQAAYSNLLVLKDLVLKV